MIEQLLDKMKKIEFLVGSQEVLTNIEKIPALTTFSDEAVAFLNDLSKELRRDPRTKELLDIQSYAFWIRKSSLEKERSQHVGLENRMGRGVAFHIAPSNVPVNFAVSMTSSLLAGNACIIRVSNKEFEQVNVICHAMNHLLENKYISLKGYFVIVRYDYDDEITQLFTDLCDVRIIWGGNETIRRIRQAQLPPRAIEMAFADRYSLAVIDAAAYLKEEPLKVAKSFYTDTYYSDQNACSSPRLVVWMGAARLVEEAKDIFWSTLLTLVKNDYELHPIQTIDKLDKFCQFSARASEISNNLSVKLVCNDNYLYRIGINELFPEIMDYKNAGGYFFEYEAKDLEELEPVLRKSCQTIALLGIGTDVMKEFVRKTGVRGVDRIVQIGKTMELSFRWDGYDMIETMSRIVVF